SALSHLMSIPTAPLRGRGERPCPWEQSSQPPAPSLRHDEPIELLAVGGDLAHGEGWTVDIGDGQRVDLGDELVRERLPGGGVVLLLAVIQAGSAGAGDQVDHPEGPGAGPAVEGGIERPAAGDAVVLAVGPGVGAGVGGEAERIGALVVVDV